MYCTERKPKNTKWGKPGNEAMHLLYRDTDNTGNQQPTNKDMDNTGNQQPTNKDTDNTGNQQPTNKDTDNTGNQQPTNKDTDNTGNQQPTNKRKKGWESSCLQEVSGSLKVAEPKITTSPSW